MARCDESERRRLFGGAAGLSERLFGEAGPELVAQGGDAAFGALHGLYWLTVNLADRGPVLLAVEDAQWADIPSLFKHATLPASSPHSILARQSATVLATRNT